MNERRGTKGLELWCRKMTQGYPGVRIDNMTTSWRDGLAFCAIIHHFRPDLIDFSKLNRDDVFYNNSLAFRVAETHLGIPALLEPEDMVECSAPDRLSILTYLSQFYQAFAVREGASPARVAPKRPQSSADHGIVSPASTSPPTKTAHTGAIVRREPCTKCGLPVFIAERLNIGKLLFHRTCFRCARCAGQLTLGNYYETENGEYCCEICPDEETGGANTKRNMSDEEQVAQLKYINSEPDEFSAVFETVLENSDAEKVQTLSREFDAARSSFFRNNVLESSDDSSCKEPPDLPESPYPAKSFPIRDVPDEISCSDNVESRNVVTKESVVRARMRLFENNSKADVNSDKVPLSPNASIPPSIKSVDNNFSETNEDNNNDNSIREDISPKDTSIIEEDTSLDSISSIKENLLPIPKYDDLIENSTREISEAIEDMTSTITSLQDSFQSETDVKDVEDVKELIEEPFTSLTKPENETPEESVNYDVKITTEIIPKTEEITQNVNYEEELKEEEMPVKAEVIDTINPNVINNVQTKTEIIPKIESITPEANYESELKEETVHLTAEVIEAINPNLTVIAKPVPMARKIPPKLEKIESYPEDLNPFDDEAEVTPKNISLNPFDEDDDDDEEEENVPIRKKLELTPAIKKDMFHNAHGLSRVSINPFEDDEDEETPPVPVRRKKINVPKSTPFNEEDDANRTLLYVQKEFRGSNSSISSGSCYGSARKKRPAPKPPIPAFNDRSNNSSLTSTPSHSVPHSPKPTPKYRKDRRAPPPPQKPNQIPAERRTSINAIKEKLDKDQVNRNLQNIEDAEKMPVQDKSTYGKWKRKKGQAPAKPIPQRRTMKCLPLAEIKRELEFIEVQQQGLERQGVRLEQIIREKCENESTNPDDDIPIEVEDLILQLFDLVNEKNELFRKQTELMYLRRQQRLEEEHADIEYQIRCLMMQPDENKTDSEKAREEELIKRLVDIVERRNQIVECLEKDRIREAEEDDTINNHINLYTLNRDNQQQDVSEVPKKEKKKDKKKEKEKKTKKSKDKLVDADKDIDEKETSKTVSDKKKKKKFNLF